ncbi:hypothetical protein PVNG_02390 [Plasmodium vivax North Korean]|uniref:RNB domain-containing protein n=1 Tax=Plasmodium vivax North Korean TaxID=1035514 RepID=A0A0J9TNC5_PLAVI|nr:hypothetical protein PVNG_02390 [Plasmodium vivax North Korean]
MIQKNKFPENLSKDLSNAVRQSAQISKLIDDYKCQKGHISLNIFQTKLEYRLNKDEDIIEVIQENSILKVFEKVVENFMILANQIVARKLSLNKIPAIYRVHSIPDGNRIENFVSDTRELVSISLSENLSIVSPRSINSFLESLRTHKYYSIIQHNLLLSLSKAEYSLNNSGHFGLNLKHYLHFTSPIRRLPDLLVHRLL